MPFPALHVHLILVVAADPDLPIHVVVDRHDHRDSRLVSVLEGRRTPGLEGLRLPIELRKAALIHRAHPDVALFIEHQIERAKRRTRFGDGQRIFGDLACSWIKHPEDVRTEIVVPDHAVGIGGRIMSRTWIHWAAVCCRRAISSNLMRSVNLNRPLFISSVPGQLMNHSPFESWAGRSIALRSFRSRCPVRSAVTLAVAGPSSSYPIARTPTAYSPGSNRFRGKL